VVSILTRCVSFVEKKMARSFETMDTNTGQYRRYNAVG